MAEVLMSCNTKNDYEYLRSNNIVGWQVHWRNLLEGRFCVRDNSLVEDDNAPIFRLGYTVHEVEEAIAATGLTVRETEWYQSQPDRFELVDGEWQEIAGWLDARTAAQQQKNEDSRIAALWQAAHDYEYAQISGSAIGLLSLGVLAGAPKCIAVKSWISSIWTLYYIRKAGGSSDVDFTVCGPIPHTVPELMAEVGA